MLRKFLHTAIICVLCVGLASAKVIKSPSYEFRKSGILKVTEIERTKDATRLIFTAKYKPRWWIKIDSAETHIQLPDGSIVRPLTIEGDVKYGEKYVMPESGETSFTVTYPPLPKSVKKIDTGATTNWAIFGIDLSGKKKKREKSLTPTPYRPIETIFESDSVTVSGRIKNYDPRSGVNVMELVIHDIAFGHTTPIAIPVKADGSFSRRFHLPMAQTANLKVNDYRMSANLYLEPKNDLEILIDYDKLLELAALEKKTDEAFSFGGSLAQFNSEINAAPAPAAHIQYTIDVNTPYAEAKKQIQEHHAPALKATEAYIAKNQISPKSAQILRNMWLENRALDLFDFADMGGISWALPEDYYTDFLTEVLLADSTLIASDSYFLLNRLGFTKAMPEKRITIEMPKFRKLMDYCAEIGVEFNDDERRTIDQIVNPESTDSVQDALSSNLWELARIFFSAGDRAGKGDEFREIFYRQKDNKFKFNTKKTESNREFIRRLTGSDEIPLIWQFAQTAYSGKNDASELLAEIASNGISNQYLISRLKEAAAPKGDGVWKLPATEAGYFMRQLIEPYQGKYLLVDFWDISCGPCRSGIESNKPIRERHRGNPGFGMLFIASEKGSPIKQYNEYVEKNLKGENVMRLPEDKMILIRELFEFTAIPRYVLFNPDGEVVNSNYHPFNFWQLLKDEGIIDEIGDY